MRALTLVGAITWVAQFALSQQAPAPESSFSLRSPAFANAGTLPVEFTGDGDGVSPPLEWSGAPEGTKSFAIIMHHEAPDRVKWYWVLYNLPADARSLPRNATTLGTLGNNCINDRIGYAPPHSKGPGAKRYIITLYALSEPVQPAVAPARVNRDVLLEAMKGRILAQTELAMTYTRPAGSTAERPPPQGPGRSNHRGPHENTADAAR